MTSVQQLNPDEALALRTLGAATVVASSGPDAPSLSLAAGKPLALLVYLAFSPGRSASRESLLDLLWADVDPEDGRHAMRQTIWYIKKRLGESVIVASRDAVRIGIPSTSDRDAFLNAIQAERLDDAVRLYEGDFLTDIALPGAVEFEHWADLERQRLRMSFLRAGQTLVRAWLAAARHRDAIALARRLRDTEASESNWRLLLECLIAAHDRVGAALEADALRQSIAADEREPEAATRALLRVVQDAPASSAVSTRAPLVSELVGRETEFAYLIAEWNNAREGHARHVELVGPAGFGKSRILVDFSARLRSQRARVALVGGRPGERFIPYALAGEIAEALAQLPGAAGIPPGAASSLLALSPALSAKFNAQPDVVDGDEALRRRSIALRELLAAVAEDRPVALVIDDWHWADDASQRVVSSAIERLSSERVLIVTAVRPTYAYLPTAISKQIALHALTEADVGAVITSIAKPPDDDAELLARSVLTASDGSPLLVLETLQWLREAQICSLEPAGWRVNDAGRLRDAGKGRSALRQRLATLDLLERQFVGTIAVAGLPLTSEFLARTAVRDARDVNARVTELERRGFVIRRGDQWDAAHDAIAETAIDMMTDAERRRAEAAVGAAWIATPSAGPTLLMRGGRHLLRAGELPAARDAFRAWLRELRRGGDRRSLHHLARDFSDPGTPEDVCQALAVSAPLRLRWSHHRVTLSVSLLAAAGILALVIAVSRALTPTPPDGRLLVVTATPNDTMATQFDIRAEPLQRGEALDPHGARSRRLHIATPLYSLALSPDGTTWATYRFFADSGGLDLVTIDVASDRERRITRARHDDVSPTWSPDMKFLVFSSGRFDSLNHNKIAVLERRTGDVRVITHGPHIDALPVWNPRGDLIAFARHYWVLNGGVALCTVTFDGADLACHRIPQIADPAPVGWYDADRIIVVSRGADSSATDAPSGLAMVNVRTMSVEWIRRERGAVYRASLDGRWIACRCGSTSFAEARWQIFAIDRPNVFAEVPTPSSNGARTEVVWVSPRASDYLISLNVAGAPDSVPLGTPFQMRADGRTADGRQVTGVPVRWSTSEPSIAEIDSLGIMQPRRVGNLTVTASAGGWVITHQPIRIAGSAGIARDVFEWSPRDSGRVVLFGDPKPSFVADPRLGFAMANNGDGSFTSGVFSRRLYDAALGVGAEAVVSTPISVFQWQRVALSLEPDIDSAAAATWDRVNGSVPLFPRPASSCMATFPAGEGPDEADLVAVGGQTIVKARALPVMRTGQPYTLRVQLLPDHRCGVAVNGQLLAVSPPIKSPPPWYRLLVEGNMYGTRILVGRTEVWSGVKSGVDWSQVRGHPVK